MEFQQLSIVKIEPPPASLPTILLSEIADRFFFNCVYTDNDDRTTGFLYVCDENGNGGKYFQSVFINDVDNGPNYRFPDYGTDITSILLDDINDDNKHFYSPSNNMPKKMKNKDRFIELFTLFSKV